VGLRRSKDGVPAGKATEGSEPDAEDHDVDHAVDEAVRRCR